MAKILLIGAIHSLEIDKAGHRTILGDESDRYFFKKYGNDIDEKTLIISEGHFDKEVITPSKSKYAHRLKKISYLLSYYKKAPHLLLCDPRYNLAGANVAQYTLDMEMLQKFGIQNLKNIDFVKPKNVEDLIAIVKSNGWNMKLPAPPDQKLKDAASRFLAVDEPTDDIFAEAVNEYQGQYEKIFLIPGTTHVLNISRKFDWEIDLSTIGPGFKPMFDTAVSYIILRELATIIT